MKREYDFSKGERGKFYSAGAQLNLPVYLEPDVREYFPDADSVNRALRCLLPLLSPKKTKRHARRKTKALAHEG
jgi:hypothetical protein